MRNENLDKLIYGCFKSESEMARRMGWNKQRLNKITTGMKTPNVNDINKMANALDTSVGILCDIFLETSHHLDDSGDITADYLLTGK